jgi:hypothetical protein
MNKPPAPEILTADNPIAAFESAIPLLLEILPHYCGSSDLVRGIVWSVYNGHPVSLHRLANLDQDRKNAALAIINFRMSPYDYSEQSLRDLLEKSGELKRRDETNALARKHGLYDYEYPLTDDQWSTLNERISKANAQ